MNYNVKSKIIFSLIFFTSFFLLYSQDNISISNSNKKKICILYFKSRYKKALINKLEEKLQTEDFIITKDLFKKSKSYNPGDYDAVIILAGLAAFTPYPGATRYIKKHNYPQNLIYFCPAYVKDAVYGFLDQDKIDAISFASELSTLEIAANEIINKLNEKLGKK